MSVERVAAKLAHDQWLFVFRSPLYPVCFRRQAIVPTNVLVTAEYVEIFTERVVDHLCRPIDVVTFHRRREQSRIIKTSSVRDQVFKKRQAGVAERRLVRHRPDYDRGPG